MEEEKLRRKIERCVAVNYMWPHFERELYSISEQRKCTLQGDGKTKNMSENFLMKEQFSQNSRKRKDKRIQEEENGESEKANEVVVKTCSKKKSKQNRRLKETPQEDTPSRDNVVTSVDNNNNLLMKKQTTKVVIKPTEGKIVADASSVRRQLNYDGTESGLMSDNSNNTKRSLEYNEIREESLLDSKRLKITCGDESQKTKNHEGTDQFSCGQLIWGKLKGFDWWPGIVVDFENVSGSQLQLHQNDVWVKWYGDNKFSKVTGNDLVPFRQFADKFLPQKFRGTYKRAVVTALEVAACRSEKLFAKNETEGNEKLAKDERAKLLTDWALDDFKPSGPEAFELIKDNDEIPQQPDHDGKLPNLTCEVDPQKTKNEENFATFLRLGDIQDAGQFLCGHLIWGKLKGFDWWPGIVVDFKNVSASQIQLRLNEVWVKWYGDNKFSKLARNDLVPFRNFSEKFLSQKFRGTYKRAVVSALEVAVSRCDKLFASDEKGDDKADDKADKEERAKLLTDWALDDFKPSGPEAFEVINEAHKVVITPNTVAPDVEWNQKEGKARFGQPIQPPALAEDVKAVFNKAASGIISIDDICLGCGDLNINVPHPLFHGSLCRECEETFLECAYLFDEDGYQMYCTICGDGKEVFMCESTGCFRSYCAVCLELICGCGTVEKISSLEKWCCVMCLDVKVGLLERREDWQRQLRELFSSDNEQEYMAPTVCPPIPPEKRQAVRVLSLFDGIGTGLQALKELGLNVELYIASEIDEKATQVVSIHHGENDSVKFVGDIEQITCEQIEQWGPFDLVIGASPCNDLSIANPGRQGIFEGTGRLFFEFFRLLMYARPPLANSRPFFWLFENVVSMRAVDKRTISRFLQCNPVVVDAKDISPARRARYFWGNLPGMNRPTLPVPGNHLTLQSCLEPNCGREARFTKIQTVTTNGHSLKQTKQGILPIEVRLPSSSVREDVLWCTEMERLFGFPPHYTDVCNMGKHQRQRLLGKAWSVPVIKHLLSPLRDYFSSK